MEDTRRLCVHLQFGKALLSQQKMAIQWTIFEERKSHFLFKVSHSDVKFFLFTHLDYSSLFWCETKHISYLFFEINCKLSFFVIKVLWNLKHEYWASSFKAISDERVNSLHKHFQRQWLKLVEWSWFSLTLEEIWTTACDTGLIREKWHW